MKVIQKSATSEQEVHTFRNSGCTERTAHHAPTMKIQKIKLRITLESDMCCGLGSGNGTNIDTLTAFDETGLPVIPGKRLKGLLRERASFLEKNGYKNGSVKALFGSSTQAGIIRVENANLENYLSLNHQLLSENSGLTNRIVSETYALTRTQTEVGKDGIAKKTSLRTTQTVKRGTRFEADILLSFDGDISGELQLLKDSVRCLRHIGLNRTRGFGEVSCEIIDEGEAKEITVYAYTNSNNVVTVPFKITLLDDIVLSGGSNISPDYISGTKLQGVFAGLAKHDSTLVNSVLHNITFKNAYITNYFPAIDDIIVLDPTPLSIYQVVDDKDDEKKCCNKADWPDYSEENPEFKYDQMAGFSKIREDTLYYSHVLREIGYHYSTWINKTDSTVINDFDNAEAGGTENQLYTFNKILKGQAFAGSISADENLIEIFKSLIDQRDNILRFGASSSSQYARAKFEFGEIAQPEQEKINAEKIMIISFLSDVVICDENGNITADTRCLMEELQKKIEFDVSNVKIFSKIVTTGGYNNKWKLPRPQRLAFSKGTTIRLGQCAVNQSAVSKYGSVGLFQNEGFGCYVIRPSLENNEELKMREPLLQNPEYLGVLQKETEEINNPKAAEYLNKEITRIRATKHLRDLSNAAINDAAKYIQKSENIKSSNVCGRLLLTFRMALKSDNPSFRLALLEIRSKNFKNDAELKGIIEEIAGTENRPLSYLSNICDENDQVKAYAKSYIGHLKREYQKTKEKSKGKAGE